MELILPTKDYLKSFYQACVEYTTNNVSTFSLPNPDKFEEWKDSIFFRYEKNRKGEDLPNGYVPSTTYWLVENDEWLGLVNIRHFIEGRLLLCGGHIGYCIRYGKWGQGIGTKQLSLALEKAKEIGIDKALITCSENNIGSARVIEKNGGIYQDTVDFTDEQGKQSRINRYWINLTSDKR